MLRKKQLLRNEKRKNTVATLDKTFYFYYNRYIKRTFVQKEMTLCKLYVSIPI